MEKFPDFFRKNPLLFFNPLLHYPISFKHLFLFPAATFVLCFASNKKLSEEQQYEILFSKLPELHLLEDIEIHNHTAHLKRWVCKLINVLKTEDFGRKFPEIFPKFLEFGLKNGKIDQTQMEEILWKSIDYYHILEFSDEMGLFAQKYKFYSESKYWDEGPCVQEFVGPRYEDFVGEVFDAGGECKCCCHDEVENCTLNEDGLPRAEGFVLEMKLKLIKRNYF